MLIENVVCKMYLLGHSNVTKNNNKKKPQQKQSNIDNLPTYIQIVTLSPHNFKYRIKYIGSKYNNTIIHTIFIQLIKINTFNKYKLFLQKWVD